MNGNICKIKGARAKRSVDLILEEEEEEEDDNSSENEVGEEEYYRRVKRGLFNRKRKRLNAGGKRMKRPKKDKLNIGLRAYNRLRPFASQFCEKINYF